MFGLKNLFKKPDPQIDILKDQKARQERMAARLEAIKKEMGRSYILHPDNAAHRLEKPRPI